MKVCGRALLAPVFLISILAPLTSAAQVPAEPGRQYYSSRQTFSVFSEYSPNSSAIVLGVAREREFFTLGFAFTQRLFVSHYIGLAYMVSVRPLMLESDPVIAGNYYDINLPGFGNVPPFRASGYYHDPHKIPVLTAGPTIQDHTFEVNGQSYFQNYNIVYGRRWTYMGGLSPIGFRANLLPREKVQPFLTGQGGFAVSPRDVPLFDSSAFNFTFSFGAGLEFYRTRRNSASLEYRLQHMSNDYIGHLNPGIDSQMLRISYGWGR